jgi:hypothetical protein
MQRRTILVENFGFCFAAAIFDLLAMVDPFSVRLVQRVGRRRTAPRRTLSRRMVTSRSVILPS